MCILMDKSLAVILNSFPLLQSFFLVKMQKSTFLRKNGFESSFYEINVQVVTNWSVRLENTKQLKICLWWIFTHF